MTLVLDEHRWAADMIASHSLGKKPVETLTRVARYYIDEGYQKREVRRMMDAFLTACDPSVSTQKWAGALDFAMTRAMKYKAIHIDQIDITDNEMNRIGELKSKQVRRLAFTLLVLAKFWDKVNPKCDHWVNTRDGDIMKLANISTSIKRQSEMYRALNDKEMIQFSNKVDNTNVRVCFIQDGNVVMSIKDLRNLGYQYLACCGSDDYIVCQRCGMVVRRNTVVPDGTARHGRAQKYCRECAAELKIQRAVNAVTKPKLALIKEYNTGNLPCNTDSNSMI